MEEAREYGRNLRGRLSNGEDFREILSEEAFQKYKNEPMMKHGWSKEWMTLGEYWCVPWRGKELEWLFSKAKASYFAAGMHKHMDCNVEHQALFLSLLRSGHITAEELHNHVWFLEMVVRNWPRKKFEELAEALRNAGVNFNLMSEGCSLIYLLVQEVMDEQISVLNEKGCIDVAAKISHQDDTVLHYVLKDSRYSPGLALRMMSQSPETLVSRTTYGVTPLELLILDREDDAEYLTDMAIAFLEKHSQEHLLKAMSIMSRPDILARLNSTFVAKIIMITGNTRLAELRCRNGSTPLIDSLNRAAFSIAAFFYNLTEDGSTDSMVTAVYYSYMIIGYTQFLSDTLFEWQKDISKHASFYDQIEKNAMTSFQGMRKLQDPFFPGRLYTWLLVLHQGYLSIPSSQKDTKERFWKMMAAFPLEIAMRVCNICYGITPSNNISVEVISMYVPLVMRRVAKIKEEK